MKSLLLPALALVFVLVSCEKAASPPVAEQPVSAPVDDTALREARDALARQAMEVETRSALLDKQLADLEARLQQSENEALRGQLEGLRQQNDQLRTQADTARRQSDTLTQRLAASAPVSPLAPPAAPRDYAVFHERLAPHGRWIDVSGHGLCFQPRLARNRTWRPYVDGCWGWSSLGWTWQTSEPFGWATYHYGRWVNLTSHGWLWVPGCEWAPAWVAWRQSRDHIGWAPLPPESGPCAPVRRDCDTRYNLGPASYTFVRTTHFVRPSYTTCIQPVSYNSTLFHHTVNITQIVPCGGGKPGGTPVYMHHGGPPRHQIEETCRQPVPQTQIHPVESAQIAIKPSNIGPPRGSPSVIELVQLPPAAQNRLPDVRPAERIENPILANPYAGVPASARPAIQQTLAAEVRQVVLADSPRPMPSNPTPEAPATLPESTPSTPEPSTSPTEPQPALTANLSAPIENRGAQPQITPPNLPTVVIDQPALMVSTPPTSSERSDRSEMSVPSAPSPIETPQPTTTATLPPAETPPATPETTSVPVIPPAADEAVRAAAEQQTQMAAAQQQQVEEAARRAAEEETARQAQMQAQTQATEAQRQAQEQAQQQAQMEAARVAQEEAQQMRAKETDRRAIEEEAARQAQMQAQSQAAEAQRLAQEQAQQQAAQMEAARAAAEEAQRQAQMEAQRQAQEEQRQAQMEAQRQAQMEAQRQAEEAARRAAEEAQRQAQMEAQRQAEEAARQAAAAAAQQPSPPPQ